MELGLLVYAAVFNLVLLQVAPCLGAKLGRPIRRASSLYDQGHHSPGSPHCHGSSVVIVVALVLMMTLLHQAEWLGGTPGAEGACTRGG